MFQVLQPSLLALRRQFGKCRIATLGPVGTDAEHLAAKLSEQVLLFESFRQALNWVRDGGDKALIPCGYTGTEVDRSSWVDLHFEMCLELDCVAVILHPIQPLAIARRENASGGKVAIQPATRACLSLPRFRDHLPASIQVVEVDNKPKAVELASVGECDYCIGSTSRIRQYKNLVVLAELQTTMAWAVYQSRKHEHGA